MKATARNLLISSLGLIWISSPTVLAVAAENPKNSAANMATISAVVQVLFSEECSNIETVVSCSTLTIASKVSISSSYPATLSCSGLPEVEVLSGGFTWSGEGPFEYFPSDVISETGEVIFNLRTRNPGVYEIKGSLTYRDSAGCEHTTKPVSAGWIQAE